MLKGCDDVIDFINKSFTLQEIDNKELAMEIVKLVKTKRATVEQIKTMGKYYGVEVEQVLNSLDEQER